MRFTGGGLTTSRGYGDTVQMRLKQSIYHVDSNELFFLFKHRRQGAEAI